MLTILGTWHGLNVRNINFNNPMTFHVILKPFTLVPKCSYTEPTNIKTLTIEQKTNGKTRKIEI